MLCARIYAATMSSCWKNPVRPHARKQLRRRKSVKLTKNSNEHSPQGANFIPMPAPSAHSALSKEPTHDRVDYRARPQCGPQNTVSEKMYEIQKTRLRGQKWSQRRGSHTKMIVASAPIFWCVKRKKQRTFGVTRKIRLRSGTDSDVDGTA